eukprot:231012_1
MLTRSNRTKSSAKKSQKRPWPSPAKSPAMAKNSKAKVPKTKVTSVWLENKQLSIRAVDYPELERPTDAIVRVLLSGICGTDLQLVQGYYPFRGVLGHEFVGVVEDIGGDFDANTRKKWIGKRVVGDINDGCGICGYCKDKNHTHCENRQTLGIVNKDGCHTTFFRTALKCLSLVPDSVSDEKAVFCEPLAAALSIQRQVHILPSTKVLVIGAGRLGLLAALSLSLTSCMLTVVARYDKQRKILRDNNIRCVTSTEANNYADRFDVVVECCGKFDGFDLATKAVKARGKVVLKSTYHGNAEVNLSALVVKEVTIIGSRCGSIPSALRILSTGKLDPTPLIDKVCSLNDALSAFEQAKTKGTLKILLKPN